MAENAPSQSAQLYDPTLDRIGRVVDTFEEQRIKELDDAARKEVQTELKKEKDEMNILFSNISDEKVREEAQKKWEAFKVGELAQHEADITEAETLADLRAAMEQLEAQMKVQGLTQLASQSDKAEQSMEDKASSFVEGMIESAKKMGIPESFLVSILKSFAEMELVGAIFQPFYQEMMDVQARKDVKKVFTGIKWDITPSEIQLLVDDWGAYNVQRAKEEKKQISFEQYLTALKTRKTKAQEEPENGLWTYEFLTGKTAAEIQQAKDALTQRQAAQEQQLIALEDQIFKAIRFGGFINMAQSGTGLEELEIGGKNISEMEVDGKKVFENQEDFQTLATAVFQKEFAKNAMVRKLGLEPKNYTLEVGDDENQTLAIKRREGDVQIATVEVLASGDQFTVRVDGNELDGGNSTGLETIKKLLKNEATGTPSVAQKVLDTIQFGKDQNGNQIEHKIDDAQITAVASELGCEENMIRAIVQVESSGRVTATRFERHVYDRNIKKNDVRQSTLLSTSWGAFQIMGFNYENAGYASVEEMVTAMNTGFDAQIQAFQNFVQKTNGLQKALEKKDFTKIAKLYNGAAQPKEGGGYADKLKDAYNGLNKTPDQQSE